MIKLMLVASLWIVSLGMCEAKSHFSLGFNRTLKDVQNSKGKVEDKPFSPYLGWGYHFNLFDSGFGFSPQLGYIHTTDVANDSFGKQTTHSYFFNWDFLYIPSFSNQMAFRFGIGNFIKRISGKGGTVEIPNGNSTTTARRPGKTVTSYSSTLNLGADYNFNTQLPSLGITDLGLRFELFTFRPLSQEYRNYAFNLGVLMYY